MTAFLIITGIVLLSVVLLKKKGAKPTPQPQEKPASRLKNTIDDLVNIEMTSSGNGTTLTLTLNEQALPAYLQHLSQPGNQERVLTAKDIAGFDGEQSSSLDGQYTVIADSYGMSGKRHSGQLALINKGKLLFKVSLQRPNDAMVSNNGVVVCCDWLNSEALTGKFLIFDSAGELIYSKKTTANLGDCAISENGQYALFETYSSDTSHSDQLFVVDVTTRTLIGHFDRPFVFIMATILEATKRIQLKNNQNFIYEVDFTGVQTNLPAYEAELLKRGTVCDKMGLYESRSEEQRFSDPAYLQLLEEALTDKDATYSYGADRIYRWMGEYYLSNGEETAAINAWEKAVRLNPKVGIARKLEGLKKKSQN